MEYIDIFDENNNPTGDIKEKTKAHEEGNFHRTAHIWIMNDKKELLLQKRSATKKSHPNCWDISGAGHIRAGETVIEGAIPAVIFSHLFDVIDMLPIQLKHNSETHNIDKKIGLEYLENSSIDNNECILLAEGNHVTGKTANIAVDLIRKKFGNDVKIIYVSLTRDYTYRNSVNNICYTSWQ